MRIILICLIPLITAVCPALSAPNDRGTLTGTSIRAPAGEIRPTPDLNVSKMGCKPLPRFALDASFAKASAASGNRVTMDARAVVTNFLRAYDEACKASHIKVKKGSGNFGVVYLKNAGDANVANIYATGREDTVRSRGVFLEYPFYSAGKFNLPKKDELKEAVYCYAVGATQKEQNESGRCLVD